MSSLYILYEHVVRAITFLDCVHFDHCSFFVHKHTFLLAGEDYNSTGLLRGSGNSNLEWRTGNSVPNVRFIVPIIDDDIPEPVEVLEIVVECENNGNCYLPRQVYTITIIDDQGAYSYHAYHLM